ncbi:hypothetical protein MHIB_15970 [Mycolicibacter hiberniae]|uniref:Uncharacterized protein n=2 Tax=Mycolicibacter hiberniae TaxID=29314 RepID=A0A7I7X004_9MYCO|nr:hypothetical protein MHIB_15970 [Mycolicibacter hiberniae]
MLNIPPFPTQMRGFDRTAVADYLARLHHEIDYLRDRAKSLNAVRTQAESNREQLIAELARLKKDVVHKAADADCRRGELIAEIQNLRRRLAEATGAENPAVGAPERLTVMMRMAAEEARRVKELACRETDALTRDLREKLVAARYERAAAGEELTGVESAARTRQIKILDIATAEAQQILRSAHEERARIAEQTAEAQQRRRALYRRLAEEDERRRLASNEALDNQIKRSWEDDERNRRRSRRQLEQKLQATWEQVEANIATIDEQARAQATALIADAERQAGALRERAHADGALLHVERAGIRADLDEIQKWIGTAGSETQAVRPP